MVYLKPNDPGILTNYAVTLAGLNQFDEAERQIALLARKGNPEEALREFLEAIRLSPEFGLTHLSAARLLAAKGEKTAAGQHLRFALQSADSNIRRQADAELQRVQ